MLEQALQTLPASITDYVVAYSGGLDSHVLLHLLRRYAKPGIRLQAIHVHHGLQPAADAWEQHCKTSCAQWQIPYTYCNITIERQAGESVEMVARRLRYTALERYVTDTSCLFTAHHQDDQAETVLLQLCRGAGPRGLSGMPALKRFGLGWHARPLLGFKRESLLAYAKEHQLAWVEDESNADLRFDRNFIRHRILPLLQSRWPGVTETVSRSAGHCARAETLLSDRAEQDCLKGKGHLPQSLSVSALMQLAPIRQMNAIRHWLDIQGVPMPNTAKLEQMLTSLLQASADGQPCVTWQGVSVRRYRDDVCLVRDTPSSELAGLVLPWDLTQRLLLPFSLGALVAQTLPGEGIKVPSAARLTIRFRTPGATCRPQGRDCQKSLKKLFQEWGVATWLRDTIPLLYCNDSLAAVIPYCICEGFAAKPNEKGWVIEHHPI